jgi:hypothetical protein
MIPSLSRIVLFRLSDGPSAGQHRPAIIVNLHKATDQEATAETLVNLQVFMDSDGRPFGDHAPALAWKTSVAQGTEPGQWSDPRVTAPTPAPAV